MSQKSLDCIEITPKLPPTASIIWLHGLGADGHDFVDIVPQLGLSSARFIFPHAPVRPITLNAGYPMRAWYDIHGLDRFAKEDEEGVRASAVMVNQLIQHEIAQGIPSDKIVLAGFSQGGAMALYAGLCYPQKLAGILALSCYLPLATQVAIEASAANKAIPIFMAHGSMDDIVNISLGEYSCQYLQNLGYHVGFHRYPMAHNVCLEEVSDIAQWFKKILE